VSGQQHAPAALAPGKNLVPIVQEAGWAPWPVWTGEKSPPPMGIRSPDRPVPSQSLYRLNYSAHKLAWYLPIKSRLPVGVFSAVAAVPGEIWTGVIINILTNIYFIFICLNSVERLWNWEAIRQSTPSGNRPTRFALDSDSNADRNACWCSSQSVSWSRNCTPFVGPEQSVSCLQQNTAGHMNRHYTFTDSQHRGISSTLLLLLTSSILFSSPSGHQNK